MRQIVKKLKENRVARLGLLGVLALVLLLAVWAVFFRGGTSQSSAYVPTEREQRLALLLSRLEGVTEATVMITEEEGAAVSVIVVFSGEDSLLTRLRVVQAVSGALLLDGGNVLVYPARDA